MAVIFADPGGEYYFGLSAAGILTAGAWTASNNAGGSVTTAPAGRAVASDGKQYALDFSSAGGNVRRSKTFATAYSHLVIGCAVYFVSPPQTITVFQTLTGATVQTDIRIDASGHLFFTRNGTTIGSASSVVVPAGWNYIEIDVLFSTSATGTAQCWLNGTQAINASSVQTANTTATADGFQLIGSNPYAEYFKDIYVEDATTGANTTHLGDVTVSVGYATVSGTNQQWTQAIGQTGGGSTPTLSVTAVNTAGVYTFSNPNIVASQLVGYNFTVTGMSAGGNNFVNLPITANTTTTFTVSLTTTTASGQTATATPICLWQDGLNHIGTWPDSLQGGDAGYLFDSTAGHISDFQHTALTLTGTLYSVVHVSYVRKDDAGARAFRQVCISGGTTETNGTDISATNTYQYYYDVLDVDPNTSSQWTVTNFNNATFGAKEIT